MAQSLKISIMLMNDQIGLAEITELKHVVANPYKVEGEYGWAAMITVM